MDPHVAWTEMLEARLVKDWDRAEELAEGLLNWLDERGTPPTSHLKFTLQSHDMYLAFEQAIFRDEGDPLRFSYPADHPLAAEFEEQTTRLLRTYKGDGEYLSVHHPDEPDARDDAPDATALAVFGAAGGSVGEIVFV